MSLARGCSQTLLHLPARWRAGPCLAPQSFGCLAAPPLCLSASWSLWPSPWTESLVRQSGKGHPLTSASLFFPAHVGLVGGA